MSWKSRATPVAANGATGNWRSRALADTLPVADYVDKLNPEQTVPDYVSTGERLIAKNFAQSPQKMAEYLKQEHPDKDFSVNANGDVITRGANGKWYVIDPEFAPFSEPMRTLKDLPADIGDVAYDIPSGIAQGVATTAAAGAGAVVNPSLALPAAMAASGATGAGSEAFRQWLGKKAGIPQEVDGRQVAMSGLVSAAAPLAFGTGKASEGTIKAVAAKLGIGMDEAKKVVENSSRGLIERGYDGIPAVQSWATGVNKDAIDFAKNQPTEMKLLRQEGVTPTAQDLSDKVNGFLSGQKTSKGQAVTAAMQNAGEDVSIEAAHKAFLNKIAALEAKPNLSNAEKSEIEALKAAYQKYFGLAGGEGVLPEVMTAPRAFDLQQKLKQAAKFERDMTPENAAVKGSAQDAYGQLNESFLAPTEGASKAAKDEYSQIIKLEKELSPKFKDAQTTVNTVNSLDKRGKVVLKEHLANLEAEGKLNLADDLDKINAHTEFYGPDKSQKSGLASLGAAIGGLMGYKTGGGYAGATAGAVAGSMAGAKAADRDLLLKFLNAQGAMESVGRKLQPSVGWGALVNPATGQMIPMALQPNKEYDAP